MKLEKETINLIKQSITLANTLGITDICIERDLVRASPIDHSVFIIYNHDIDVPFDSLGITRIPQLLSRLNIITNNEKYTIEMKEQDGEVRLLTMKCTGTKIEFKCSNPSKVIAPRKVNDPMTSGINISPDCIDMLKSSQAAMKSDLVTFIADDDGVRFEINDVNNDTLTHKISENVICLDDVEDVHFTFKYPIKLLLTLLKNDIDYFEIGKVGTMKINVNNFDMYIPPRV